MPPSRPQLQLTNVSRHYEGGPVVLRDVDLTLDAGDALAITGPSGSGKSTLLNVIGGLDRPTSGTVLLEGVDLADMDDDALARLRNRRIGLVFQSHHLLPQCTALENVLVPTLVNTAGRDRVALRERAETLLAEVGLGDRMSHPPGRLSGGECQRVAVVRALINEPALVLADEPTGSLDATAADTLGELLVRLNRERGVTLIVVTHSARLADRIGARAELTDGTLVREQPAASVP